MRSSANGPGWQSRRAGLSELWCRGSASKAWVPEQPRGSRVQPAEKPIAITTERERTCVCVCARVQGEGWCACLRVHASVTLL